MKPLFLVCILALFVSCNDDDNGSDPGTPAPDAPKSIGYSVLNTFPHDTSSFTQGLVIYNGIMYEGTGEYGHSKLLKVDLTTGKIQQQLSLDPSYFGEGITILRDTIYQLTWQERKVFAYTLDFRKVKEFDINTQGWGITTNGKELIVSDGSNNLYYYEPGTFRKLRSQSVSEAGKLAYNLNELEYINGFIYANKWQAPEIFKIDPATGYIVGIINVNDVWNKIKVRDPAADVPNGIAFDEATGKIYITGKKWPELYEIQLAN